MEHNKTRKGEKRAGAASKNIIKRGAPKWAPKRENYKRRVKDECEVDARGPGRDNHSNHGGMGKKGPALPSEPFTQERNQDKYKT